MQGYTILFLKESIINKQASFAKKNFNQKQQSPPPPPLNFFGQLYFEVVLHIREAS